jgi:hypothetical protein
VDIEHLAAVWAKKLTQQFEDIPPNTLQNHIRTFILPRIISKAHEWSSQTHQKTVRKIKPNPKPEFEDDDTPSTGKRGRYKFIENLRMFLLKLESMNSDIDDSIHEAGIKALELFISQIELMLNEKEKKEYEDEDESLENNKITKLLNDIIMFLSSPPPDSESDSDSSTTLLHTTRRDIPDKVIHKFRNFIEDYQPDQPENDIIAFLRTLQSGGSTHTKHNHTTRKNRNDRRHHKSTKTSKYIRKNKYKSNTKKNRKNRR